MLTMQRSLCEVPARQRRCVRIRLHRVGDVGWAIERHGQLYSEEFGWNEEFEALVTTLFARFLTKHDSAERFWVAQIDHERGRLRICGALEKDKNAAQLRCLLVDPRARGLGVGRRLVDECIEFSKIRRVPADRPVD